MRRLITTILLCLACVAAGPSKPRFPAPVEIGCVVPYQPRFVEVNPVLWKTRAAQAWCESGFNAKAVSPVGAKGLTQFMPATWKEWMPATSDPFNPNDAILAQDKYMKWLEARLNNDLDAALGSYNAGLGNIRKAQRLADQLGMSGSGAWMRVYPQVQKNPMFVKETLGYVSRNSEKRAQIDSLLKAQSSAR